MNNCTKDVYICIVVYMKKKIAILIVILVAIFLSISISHTPSRDLKIGVITVGSGEYASAGEMFTKGIQLALDEYKEKNPNMNVQIVIEDDGFNAGKGLSAYKKLTELDKVDAIINLSTPTIGSIYDASKADNMPLVQGGIQVATATQDHVFQISPDGNKALTSYGSYIATEYAFKNVAVVRDNTDYHLGFLKGLKQGFPENYPLTEYVHQGGKDLRTLATQLSQGKYDAIVFLMNPETGVLLSKELLVRKTDPNTFFYDMQIKTGLAEYKKILGSLSSLQGAKILAPKEGDRSTYEANFKNKYNIEPGFFTDYGYDAFTALIYAHADTKEQWIQNLEHTNIQGADSVITFDENGVRQSTVQVETISGDIMVLYKQI